VRDPGVQRVVEALLTVASPHLDLVLDPRTVGQVEHEIPQVGSPQPAHRHPVGQPDDALHEEYLVGVATVEERASWTFDDGYLVPRKKSIYDRSVDRRPLLEPVDGELSD
jgi:hypothetical protein